jgi:hypothetical protein
MRSMHQMEIKGKDGGKINITPPSFISPRKGGENFI